MFDLFLTGLGLFFGGLTLFFILRWDRRMSNLIERVEPAIEPIQEIGETVQATLESPEAMGNIIDRAVSTAVLTWQRSNAGQKGGDARLDKNASKLIRGGIKQFISEQNPVAGLLIDGIMEYAKDWIGEDPDGRRESVIWDQMIKMAGSLSNLPIGNLSVPRQQRDTGSNWD